MAERGGASGRSRGSAQRAEIQPAQPAQPAQPLHAVRGSAPEHSADEGALALDRLIHERMRLGIVSALAVNEALSFNDLKRLMGTTDGNLSVHARKLEDAAYISCTKTFRDRMPLTEYRLTAAGRRALERYLDHMEALIRATREG